MISQPRSLLMGLSLVLAACGGEGLTLPPDGAPAAIEITWGNDQSGRVRSTLAESLVVRVTDTQDRPVAGAEVVFEFTADGSAASPATVNTDADGIAWSHLILGTRVGPAGGTVRVPVDDGVTPVEAAITATVLPGDANGIAKISGDDQSAPVNSALPAPLVVQVTDQVNNPISGVIISWTFTGGGSVSSSATITGDDGMASVTRTLGPTAGQQTTVATTTGLDGSPLTFTHVARPGSATGVVKISGDGQSALAGTELTDPLVVQVLDGQQNPITGRDVTWIVTAGDGQVPAENTKTDGQGFANTRWTLGPSAGANSLNAVVSGVGTATFTATGTAGVPSGSTSLVSASPDRIAAGGTSTITVTVRDAGNNPVAGVSVTPSSSGTGNSITPASASTGANGQATFTFSSSVGETKTITATAGGISIDDGATITVEKVASNTDIESDDPDPSIVGAAVRVVFTVTGSGGTPTGLVTVTADGGTESCSGTVADGFCDITLTSAASNRRLTATYEGDSRFAGSSERENHRVNAPTPVPESSTTEITNVQPEPSTSGQEITVTFQVTRGGGGTPAGGTVTIFSFRETGGCEVPVSQGSCTFTLDEVGTHTLGASYSGDDQTEDSTDPDGQQHVVNPATPTNQPPTAAFTAPATCTVGTPCAFDGSTSSDPEAPIANWTWTFGDPTTTEDVSSGPTPTASYQYNAAGTYSVTLTVTDVLGVPNSVAHDVIIP